MQHKVLATMISLGLLVSVFATSSASQEKAKVKGMIRTRTGEH